MRIAAPMKSVIKWVVVVILVVKVQLMGVSTAGSCTCHNVSDCVNYFERKWNTTAFNKCCGGIKILKAACRTREERRGVCSCIRNGLGRHSISINDVNSVLSKCNVNIGYKITPNFNCANVK